MRSYKINCIDKNLFELNIEGRTHVYQTLTHAMMMIQYYGTDNLYNLYSETLDKKRKNLRIERRQKLNKLNW